MHFNSERSTIVAVANQQTQTQKHMAALSQVLSQQQVNILGLCTAPMYLQ